MTTLKMENKPKKEEPNKHRLFNQIPKDTLAESQATMRSAILCKDENDNISKFRP
jgi:hypothetical protein